MPNALMSCGKIIKTGHKIILDDPIATVVNKLTNEVVMKAEFDPRTSTWNVYPDGPVPSRFNKKQKETHLVWEYNDNNKKELLIISLTMYIH